MGWSACAQAGATSNLSSYHHNVEFEGCCEYFLNIVVVVAVVWVKTIVVHGRYQRVNLLRNFSNRPPPPPAIILGNIGRILKKFTKGKRNTTIDLFYNI